MLATVTKLTGRRATYTSNGFTPNVTGEVRTYGQIDDDTLRVFLAQQHGGQAHDYDLTRPDAA